MKKKNIAISFLLLLVAAGIWYYVSLPAFNIHSSGVWYFVLVLVLAVGLVFAGKKGLRYGAIDLKEMKESKGFKWCVRLFILLLVIYLAGTILSSPIVNAKKYQQLLKVEEGEFTKDIEELSFDQIPLLDKESAQLLGDRKMGSMSDMVSQFEVDDIYSQINYKDRPVRVSPLKYANLIKWFTNRKDGLPAYIRIDMASQTTEMVKLEQGMKYSTSEHFGRNIYRHLRFAHPTYIYGELSFEIDDNGVPYWVAPVKKYNIGLFGGETVGHVVLCNAITQKDCLKTTNGYNYLAIDDDVWVYTGVTSVNSDQSNVGFVLMNQRTMETKYYPVAGAIEDSAMASAEGQVQNLKYRATFPLLLNISGEPTYFMALKDDAGLVKKYAMVNVQKYQVVAIGDTVSACEESYNNLLLTNGIKEKEEVKMDTGTIEGKITKIAQGVIDGDSHYYIMLEGSDEIFDVSVVDFIEIIKYNVGDDVKLEYAKGDKANTVLSLK